MPRLLWADRYKIISLSHLKELILILSLFVTIEYFSHINSLILILIIHCWMRLSRLSPGSAFFGSPIKQSLPRQHLNLGSPSIGNMLKIATSSSFSFARLILSSPTVFVCRCSLLDSRSLNASVAIFLLAIQSLSLSLKMFMQTNTRTFTGCCKVYTKRELWETELSLLDTLHRMRLSLTCNHDR